MSKRVFGLVALCAAGSLALIVSPGSHSGVAQGKTPPRPPQAQAAKPADNAGSAAAKKTIHLTRAPERVVEDTFSSPSAVAEDVNRNEIIVEDENRDQLIVYGRLDNTPAAASMTEPKRVIGGRNTKISENCGLYVDPFSGDIYSVNGDTTNYMTVWTREQKGNEKPERALNVPHRAFAVAVDEQAKEMYITIEAPAAVVVYDKTADGQTAPKRILEGDKTLLADAHGIALDTKNGLMYISNQGATASNTNDGGWQHDVNEMKGKPDVEWMPDTDRWRFLVPGSGSFLPPSITVFPMNASGDAAPVRVIRGPHTKLDWPAHISLDPDRQELYVANTVTNDILVFRATDNGDATPIRIIHGPKTGLSHPHGVFVDTKNNELVAANFGNHSSTIYPRDANGDVAPLRTIRSAPANAPAPMFGNIGALAYDTKRDQVLAPN
jgi:DNA-binding beta-propeller fold protein YncE